MTCQIKDYDGNKITLYPRIELYSVKEMLSNSEMPGLAVFFDYMNPKTNEKEEFAVLTKNFGEFIGFKNTAYIDTNNCYFANQVLDLGIATDTGFYKCSGFCSYPLWEFDEEFLKETGGEKYRIYSDTFDEYMGIEEESEDMGITI